MKQKVIALVDCDCFFVSCERVDNPLLNKKPVCVCTGVTSKGIVISRSNEAKALGIKMGQPLFQLKGKYPEVVYLPARHKRYNEISQEVMSVLRDFSPLVEEVSVDEAYLDLTGMSKFYQMTYRDLIVKIKQTIFDKTKVPVSIGLSTSKTLAKLASDKAKQTGGIYIISPSKIKEILQSVQLEEICGIGKQSLKNYQRKGIVSVEDFLNQNPDWLKKVFGINAYRLRYELEGIALSEVKSVEEKPQSIQNSHSFENFITDLDALKFALPHHIHQSSQKLRTYDGYCGVLGVMLRTKNFQVFEKEVKLTIPTNSEITLLKEAIKLLEKIYQPKTSYRSLGVSLKDLVFGYEKELSLFNENQREDDKISHLLDELEHKFGKEIVKLGS